MNIPKRMLGSTGVEVTSFGLGGEGVLRTVGYDRAAYSLINEALDLGVTYCESARAYSDSESYYGKALCERRNQIFLTSKSHARDRLGAQKHLIETLTNMKTDWLDLWQVHDVRTEDDLRTIFGPDGAIEAFDQAKKDGKARFIGITGHQDPVILRKALDLYSFDTVLMPVNPAEANVGGFITDLLPVAVKRNMGIIGMKVYFRGLAQMFPWYTSMEPFLRFALSQPISTVVIGCDSVEQLRQNTDFAVRFTTMNAAEQESLIRAVEPLAGKMAYYKPH